MALNFVAIKKKKKKKKRRSDLSKSRRRTLVVSGRSPFYIIDVGPWAVLHDEDPVRRVLPVNLRNLQNRENREE